MKSVIPVLILFLFAVSGPVFGQETPDPVKQFRRTVFKLQQEMLELKEQFDRQDKELTAQREQMAIEIERLSSENKTLKKRLFELDGLLFQLEDRLEDSAIIKLSKEIANLRNLIQATILETLDHPEQSEKLLLDIINQPGTSLPKDLLILLLAQQKTREADYDDAISYYSTLLAEFFGSPYFSQAIYEMSEILGQTGRTDNQITLLSQLSSLSDTDKYSLKAAEKLDQLGLEVLHPEEFSQYEDTTADHQMVEERRDTSPDMEAVTVLTDSTADAVVNVAADLSSDVDTPQSDLTPTPSDATADSPPPIEEVEINPIEPEEALTALSDPTDDTTASIVAEAVPQNGEGEKLEQEREKIGLIDPSADITGFDTVLHQAQTAESAPASVVEPVTDSTHDQPSVTPSPEADVSSDIK